MNDIVTLLYVETQDNGKGMDVNITTEYEVFCEVKSVTCNEFYKALATGLAPTLRLHMRKDEYEQTRHIVNKKAVYAQKVIYNDAEYEIVRTYAKDLENIELTCK